MLKVAEKTFVLGSIVLLLAMQFVPHNVRVEVRGIQMGNQAMETEGIFVEVKAPAYK